MCVYIYVRYSLLRMMCVVKAKRKRGFFSFPIFFKKKSKRGETVYNHSHENIFYYSFAPE